MFETRLMFMLTGKSNVLAMSYFPAIDLGDGDYELSLTDFEMYYTLANLTNKSFTTTMRKLSFPKDRMNCAI